MKKLVIRNPRQIGASEFVANEIIKKMSKDAESFYKELKKDRESQTTPFKEKKDEKV